MLRNLSSGIALMQLYLTHVGLIKVCVLKYISGMGFKCDLQYLGNDTFSFAGDRNAVEELEARTLGP